MIHPDSDYYPLYQTYSVTEWGQKYLVDLEDKRRANYLGRLELSVAKARYKVMGVEDLLRRLGRIWEDAEPSRVVDELVELDLSAEDEDRLRDMLNDLLTTADGLPAKHRLIVNRAIYRLLFRLPYDRTGELRERCLHHRLKLVRMAAYRALRHSGITKDEAPTLLEQYRNSQDQRLLELIAYWPRGIASVDDHYVIQEMSDQYWRMRAIQGLIQADPERAWAYAEAHPYLFVWAVGRARHPDSLKVVRALLEEHKNDPEFIWWCIWTFGRAGSPTDVSDVEAVALELLDREMVHASGTA